MKSKEHDSDSETTGESTTGTNQQEIAKYAPEPGTVTVFSAEWCAHCIRLKNMLQHVGVAYHEVLIEQDPVAEQIAAEANGGDWLIPTVLFSDGSIRVHPGLRGVQERLAQLDDDR